MRTSIRIVMFCLGLTLIPRALPAGMTFDQHFLVYTKEQGRPAGVAAEDVEKTFDRLLGAGRPVVLFIHGRGNEPGKSLEGTGIILRNVAHIEGRAVDKLQAYDDSTVLFSWNSKRCGFLVFGLRDRTCPLAETDAGATRLDAVLKSLDHALLKREQAHLSLPAITLVAHSMGTIVLQKFVEQHEWPRAAGHPMFTNVILTSSDADNTNHAAWVDRIGAVEHVFITVNAIDPVLAESAKDEHRSGPPLGKDPGAALAATPKYVVLQLDAHEIFAKGQNRGDVENFFAALFNGHDVPLGNHLPGQDRQFPLRRTEP